MSSNRVVSYIDIGLNSVDEYWDALIVQNVRAFRALPSAPALFNVSHAVWHLHDWVWHEQNPGENSRGPKFDAYRDQLLVDCPQLSWLRDIADAGKHRGLGRLTKVKGAEPREFGRFRGLLTLTDNAQMFFLVLNDGTQEMADNVVRTAVMYWHGRLKSKKLILP